MPRTTVSSRLDAIEAMLARLVPASAPVVTGTAAAPLYVAPSPLETGKTCRCGHEHQRPVRSDLRARLASETACHIKACVSRPACAGIGH